MDETDRREALIREAAELADISDFDVVAAVNALPTNVREALAEGEWPEPHCGVCRALDSPGTREDLFRDVDTVRIAMEVVLWHDEPLKTGYRWQGGPEQYARCQVIYATARESLA